MRFQTTLLRNGKTATGIEVPVDVLAYLGHGKRPPVRITINDHTYRSTVAVMGGRSMVGVSAENRAAAGIAGGDEIDVDMELDDEPRVVEVPEDLAAAFGESPAAREFFERLSYSQQRWYVLGIEQAKTEETRTRRIHKAVEALAAGRKNG